MLPNLSGLMFNCRVLTDALPDLGDTSARTLPMPRTLSKLNPQHTTAILQRASIDAGAAEQVASPYRLRAIVQWLCPGNATLMTSSVPFDSNANTIRNDDTNAYFVVKTMYYDCDRVSESSTKSPR